MIGENQMHSHSWFASEIILVIQMPFYFSNKSITTINSSMIIINRDFSLFVISTTTLLLPLNIEGKASDYQTYPIIFLFFCFIFPKKENLIDSLFFVYLFLFLNIYIHRNLGDIGHIF